MELFLDSINLDEIQLYSQMLPLAGVTSNPSIIKKEGKIEFVQHMKKVQKLLEPGSLHIQVIGQSVAQIINDSETIVNYFGRGTYVKIPVSKEGLEAIHFLKKEHYKLTATAIYSEFQGYLAIEAGVDYLAPYYNRMENIGVDAPSVIGSLANEIARTNSSSKILAASFKNTNQVNAAIREGAHAVTLSPEIYFQGLNLAVVREGVAAFSSDWFSMFSSHTINGVE